MVAVILAIDPGRVSGVCVLGDGPPMVCEMGDILMAKHRLMVMQLIAGVPTGTLAVLEDVGYLRAGLDWRTTAGIGKRFGAWWTLCSIRGLKCRAVHPNEWQHARLHVGRRNPGREMLKALSVARARKALGRDVGVNAADAWNLAEYVRGT